MSSQICCNHTISSVQLSKNWSFTKAVYTETSSETTTRKTFFLSLNQSSTPQIQTPSNKALPDIRKELQPWYFPNAEKNNEKIAMHATSCFIEADNNSASLDFNRILEMIKKLAGFAFPNENHNCCLSELRPQTSYLSEPDKEQLQNLHHYADSKGVNTKFVNFIAIHLSLKSRDVSTTEQQTSLLGSKLDTNFFSTEITKLNFWQHEVGGREALQTLESFFEYA